MENNALVKLTLSIGSAVCPDDGNSLLDLLNQADKALYTAKDRGKDRIAIYAKDPNDQVLQG